MAKTKAKYYAVRTGRHGPMIYRDWTSCENAVKGFSNARYKGFQTLAEAEEYVVANSNISEYTPLSFDSPQDTRMPGSFNSDNIDGFGPNRHRNTSSSRTPHAPYPALAGRGASPRNATPIPSSSTHDHVMGSAVEMRPEQQFPLSTQQQEVLNRVKSGENVFFTGSAGTGKSVLLRAIIKTLRADNVRVAVTASTGIAAVNIYGITLHSFAGIRLGKEPAHKLVKRVKDNAFALERWVNTQTLVIDEISMLDGTLFDKLDVVGRSVRGSSRPFGGMQLVVSGDFCQLPPVPDRLDGFEVPIKFAFEAECWQACMGLPVLLSTVFRQKDSIFVNMLNNMRYGQISPSNEARFLALSRAVVYADGIEPSELYPKRHEVHKANSQRLDLLPGPSHTYDATDHPGRDSDGKNISLSQMETLLERLVAVKKIVLKIGAQVMLIKNMEQGHLVNGSLGTVVAFKSAREANQEGVEVAKAEKHGEKDLQKYGQENGSSSAKMSHMKIEEEDQKVNLNDTRVWPVVRFINGRELLCMPDQFNSENARGEMEASRSQIPLILAWALSIHKSQGQTLERVKVDLEQIFEKGQAYVALSRATKLETLQVLNFDKNKVMAHPRVLAWHQKMEDESDILDAQSMIDDMDNEEAIRAYFDC